MLTSKVNFLYTSLYYILETTEASNYYLVTQVGTKLWDKTSGVGYISVTLSYDQFTFWWLQLVPNYAII